MFFLSYFFFFWESNNNNNNNRNAVSLQKNITEPFRRLQTRHLVDTKSLHFGIKTIKNFKKRYPKLHFNTIQGKQKAKGWKFIPIQRTWTDPKAWLATCLSKRYKNCLPVRGGNRRWKQQNTFGYMFETATMIAMHGLISYRFPTAVREILKGLLR